MSEIGKIFQSWWEEHIAPRDVPAARALAARLRRATQIEALCEPEVIALARRLKLGPQEVHRLIDVVTLLAEVRQSDPQSLAARLGGTEPNLSRLRFQNLMRADRGDLGPLLRRAVQMADRKCNVASLAADFWYWNEPARRRWCFDYFDADASQPIETEKQS